MPRGTKATWQLSETAASAGLVFTKETGNKRPSPLSRLIVRHSQRYSREL